MWDRIKHFKMKRTKTIKFMHFIFYVRLDIIMEHKIINFITFYLLF